MRLLDRYILRELLVPLGYCLCGFLLFWVFGDLFAMLNEFRSRQMQAGDILEYYLVTMPEFLALAVPVALLLALLYSLTHHARHNELTAMRAAGVSLWRLCLPYFAVGLLGSAAVFVINEYWLPDSSERGEQILTRRQPLKTGASRRDATLTFRNDRDDRTWKISAYDADRAEMTRPEIVWKLPDGSARWLFAERAARAGGVWVFTNVQEYFEPPHTNALLEPLLKTNLLAMPEFTETPEQIRSELRLAGSMSTLLRGVKKADIPIAEILNYLRLHPEPRRAERDYLYTKLHGRLAAPLTCLVVVLIAVPFGAASGRRNVFVGVAASIAICFAYFVLQQLGLTLGAGGWVPPWLGAWLPNLVFGGAGAVMTARVR
jgi:lipopolysaccharide export system permease protein